MMDSMKYSANDNKLQESELSEKEKDMLEYLNSRKGYLPYYDCPICLNRGTLSYYDKNHMECIEYCTCSDVRKTKKRIIDTGLKASFDKYSFDNFMTDRPWRKELFSLAKEFINDIKQHQNYWFLISGDPGFGKTHICISILNELVNNGNDIEYISFFDDLPKLQRDLNNFYVDVKDKAEMKLMKSKTSKVLYIDDFLKTTTDVSLSLLFQILNHRYADSNLVTIISTERSLSELVDYDRALSTRILERTTRKYVYKTPKEMKDNHRLKDFIKDIKPKETNNDSAN